jgi:hypothetical protein
MSSSVVGAVPESVQDVNVSGQLDVNQANRNSRNERSGKGRRRRAAAEQRRIDQQRWGQYITDEEDETAVGMAPRSGNRRRARRNNRNNSTSSHHLEDYYQDELAFHANQPRNENCEDFDLEMALSLSLSLEDPPLYSGSIEYSNQGTVNMSYESLVQLENVKCVAPANVVNSMPILTFDGNKSEQGSADEIEKCTICQCEYEFGDQIISLPCAHGFHNPCGAEWLLNHSKLCPICKHNVMDQKFVDT